MKSQEGKKIFVEGKIYPVEKDQIEDVAPCVTAEALMIKVDWSKEIQKVLKKLFT